MSKLLKVIKFKTKLFLLMAVHLSITSQINAQTFKDGKIIFSSPVESFKDIELIAYRGLPRLGVQNDSRLSTERSTSRSEKEVKELIQNNAENFRRYQQLIIMKNLEDYYSKMELSKFSKEPEMPRGWDSESEAIRRQMRNSE
ncbi:MAG: hypothetical protein AAFP82_06545, partial [Bacteroidota bacterium]